MKANAKSHTHCQVAQKTNRTSQNLSISMALPTLPEKSHGHTTMAKKHRGFGSKLEFRASIENRQTKILITKKEN